jgi:isoleucyl-tRNA synthetase
VDGWEWEGNLDDPYQELTHPLDQWIVSRVHQLTQQVTDDMDRYDLPNALKGILPFIDDASNWYIRRSRKRFWKSENDQDKNMAYKTLHYVLVRLSLVLAPFTPFLAEELFRGLTMRQSVHLCDWPAAGHVNGIVIKEMSDVRRIITIGLSVRAEKGIKVRQPLPKITLHQRYKDLPEHMLEIIREELNVKQVGFDEHMIEPDKTVVENIEEHGLPQIWQVVLDTNLTPELKREGIARELIRHIQNARKTAGLNVDDRISLRAESDSEEVMKAFSDFKDEIYRETLTISELTGDAQHSEEVKLDDSTAQISLSKN